MVYDIITFNGELEMLEIRLQILAPYVDKFIIVEATQTFSGKEKELSFDKYRNRFKEWGHKIIYHVLNDFTDMELYKMAKNSSNTGDGESYWMMEFIQKEMIKDALIGLDDEDICFISDADEIWNPEILPFVQGDDVYKPKQDLTYIYYLNQRTEEDWTYFTGTIVTKYKNIKDVCLNHLRTHSKNTYTFIENGGWHFNALGGMEKKLESFKHPVYTKEYMHSREKGVRIDETGLPIYLLQNKEKYTHLWK